MNNDLLQDTVNTRYGYINKGKRNLLFLLILSVIHLAFFLLAMDFKRIYNGDSFEYIYAAVNLKDHLFFYSGNPALPISPEYMTFRTPGYPLLLAAVYSFSVNNWLVLVLQNILSVCNLYLLRKILIRLGYQTRYDWLLLLLLLTYPAQFIHANIIEPEILLQSFVLLYIHQLTIFFRERRTKQVWLMSLLLTLGLFIKPVLYPYTAIHIILIAVLAFRKNGIRHHRYWAAIALIPVFAILCYNSWNESRTGKFHFTSNQSFNAIYYFYFYKSSTEGLPAARKFLSEERGKIAAMPAFRDRYDYAHKRGRELFLQNSPGYIFYHLKHSLRFLADPGKGDIDLFTGRLTYGGLYQAENRNFTAFLREHGLLSGSMLFFRNSPGMGAIGIIFLFNLIKIAGLFLFMRSREIPVAIRTFTLLFIAYFALLTGPIATPRYVLPVSPLYAGAAVLGFMFLFRSRKTGVVIHSVP